VVPPDRGEELAAEIPGADLVRVPGAGHAVILEQPGLVNDAIRALLDRAGAGAGAGADASAGEPRANLA